MKKLHTRKGGFTLIELMIVVAIIGILAAIAIPNFLRFQLKAKSSEGKTNIAAIRTAEESFFAEFNRYVSADASPATIGDNVKVTFTDAGSVGANFATMGWDPEGEVFFNYAVQIGTGNTYNATAAANIDAVANAQLWGYRRGAVAGKSHGTTPAACTVAQPVKPTTVSPCDAVSGQSVF